MKKKIYSLFISLVFIALSNYSQKYEPKWESLDKRTVPEWFSKAKFGIFIHWGIYSVPAWAPTGDNIKIFGKYAEWYWNRLDNNKNDEVSNLFRGFHKKQYGPDFKYQDFAPLFKAELFEPEQWAEIFYQSGAKYIVLTSKHHEGFTLWPSAHSWNWNSVDIGPHRDICKDLSEAVKAKGMHMGFYYSLYEWFNPVFINHVDKYVDEHMIPQMKDLVTRYEPDILWTDGEWNHPSKTWKSEEFLAWLYNESTVKNTIAVNDRWGKETRIKHGGFYTTEYNHVHGDTDIGMPDHPWEECRGIGTSFGYNRAEDIHDYSTSEQVIHLLIEKVSAGGNLLLDVGPTADGRIPVIMQQRLKDIGAWLKVNGEAIYGSTKWKNSSKENQEEGVYFTQKGNDLYVICTKWPEKKMVVRNINTSGKVSMLGYNKKVISKHNGTKLIIEPPTIHPGNMPCLHAWVFKVEGIN